MCEQLISKAAFVEKELEALACAIQLS